MTTAKAKHIKSILPDSLDIIEEGSETSSVTSAELRAAKFLAGAHLHDAASNTGTARSRTVTIEDERQRVVPQNPFEKPEKGTPVIGSTDTTENSSGSSSGSRRRDIDHLHNSVIASSESSSLPRRDMIPSQNSEGLTETPLFNYDEDFDEEQVETEPEQLTWRLDPQISLSDWTIKVITRETRQAEYYHVHKNILAVGPRRGEYFVRNFRNSARMNKDTGSSTEVHLMSVAAKCIPQLLDYMYSNEGHLYITTELATGLRHLAQFFGIRPLHKKVMDFIVEDLSMKNVVQYYRDAVVLDDDNILDRAAEHCADNIMEIEKANSLLLTSIDPAFFRRLMMSDKIDSKEKHYHISLLLAEYCMLNKQILDDQDFVRLSDARCLPVVHHEAALTLMETEADLVIATSLEGAFEVSSLQERCISDLTVHWEELSSMSQDRIFRVCRKLSSSVLSDILVKSLIHAKRKVDEIQNDPKITAKQLNASTSSSESNSKEYKEKLGKLKKDFDAKSAALKKEHQEAMENMKKEYETNLLKLRDLCIEKDKHISNYWEEIKRFERLPNQPEGKVIQSGIMQKPTKMPEIGNHSPEGFLLVNKKNGPRYPIFYYKVEE